MLPEQEKSVVFADEASGTTEKRAFDVPAEPFVVRAILATKVIQTPAQAKIVLIVFAVVSLAISTYLFANLGPKSIPLDTGSLKEDI
jgi:hypothetical protein